MARYGSALRRYFAKRVPPAEAEDLVQDVFLAMQVRGEIRDPEQADREIARRMGVSVRTVEHFVSRAMRRIYASLEASA